MQETKRSRILASLKKLVLNTPDGVTRNQAAEALNIDLRTAASYLEQLAESGFLCSTCEKSGQRGRPGSLYRSNVSQLCFLGLNITQNLRMFGVLIDSDGRELKRNNIQLPEYTSRLTLYSQLCDMAKKLCLAEERKVYGAALAISRWLQPPLTSSDNYSNLCGYLSRELKIPVHRDININALACAYAMELASSNLAMIHAGHVLEFGLIRDRRPEYDFVRREQWLSHLCVNPKGRQCYCGKYGCLENYVTVGALRERLAANNSLSTIRALGEMLGYALTRVAKKYAVDTIVLVGADELHNVAQEYFHRNNTEPARLLVAKQPLSVPHGAAVDAALCELHQYINLDSEMESASASKSYTNP